MTEPAELKMEEPPLLKIAVRRAEAKLLSGEPPPNGSSEASVAPV